MLPDLYEQFADACVQDSQNAPATLDQLAFPLSDWITTKTRFEEVKCTTLRLAGEGAVSNTGGYLLALDELYHGVHPCGYRAAVQCGAPSVRAQAIHVSVLAGMKKPGTWVAGLILTAPCSHSVYGMTDGRMALDEVCLALLKAQYPMTKGIRLLGVTISASSYADTVAEQLPLGF